MFSRPILALAVLSFAFAAGCSPVSIVEKVGMHAVGQIVDDSEVDKLGQELVGRRPSAADAKLGKPLDVLRDIYGYREWVSYPATLDPLKTHRFIVEVAEGQIVGIEKVAIGGNELDIPLRLYYYEKVKGMTPAACEQALGMGPPLKNLRSLMTGELVQFYDGRLIKELQGTCYCVVKFDHTGGCVKLALVEVSASTN